MRTRTALIVFAITCALAVIFLSMRIEAISATPSSIWIEKGLLISLLNVFCSILAAALVSLGVLLYNQKTSHTGYGKFKKLFEINESDQSIIILPRFEIQHQRSNDPDNFGINQKTLKKISEADKDALSFNDIVAVRHITTMFAENGFLTPKIYFDDDAYKVFFEKTSNNTDGIDKDVVEAIKNAKTIIIIGLFSNCITTELNSIPVPGKSFKITDSYNNATSDRKLAIAQMANHNSKNNYLSMQDTEKHLDYLKKWTANKDDFSVSAGEDFALISKMKWDKKNIIIIGGEHARGTRKAASYLKKYWKDLMDYTEPSCKSNIGDSDFSLSLLINKDKGLKPHIRDVHYIQKAHE